MELRHLRYFSALAESLNFTVAAQNSHVSQSTLSHQIKQLEAELGVQLFDRIKKKVQITEAGTLLLEQIKPALLQIDVAINALHEGTQKMEGSIRIGTTHSFNSCLVPQCIAKFIKLHPNIHLVVEELSQDGIIHGLDNSELDMAIAYQPTSEHNLWFEPIYNEEMVLVVAKNHPLANRRKIRMIELHNLAMTLLPKSFATRRIIDDCFSQANSQPRVVAELNSIVPMMELIAHSNLAGIIGASAITNPKDLCLICLEEPTPCRTPGLLWKRGAPSSSAIKQFASVVREVSEGSI